MRGPDLTPAGVTETEALGGTFDVTKTVHTPPIPPIVDICLVEDETGSFANDIANLQALIPDLITELDNTGSNYATCVIGFRDFDQNGWGSPNDHVYRPLADVQVGGAGFTAGAPLLSAPAETTVPKRSSKRCTTWQRRATPRSTAMAPRVAPTLPSDRTRHGG